MVFVILPLNPRVIRLARKHGLEDKFYKQLTLLSENPRYPSLNLELLEPKHHGIYSFRIDRKYRALLIFRPGGQFIEILTLTVHYR